MDAIFLKTEADLIALGGRLGRVLRPGDTVALNGGLGAGKTTLVRGLVQTVSPETEVPSPTYTLVQTYDLPDYELWHCDAYRLEHPDEIHELGVLDAMDNCVVIIEWPEKIGGYLPPDALRINIDFDADGRQVTLMGWEGRDFDS